ncbi:DYW10 [Acrasis kona]|uniref:DYW10 n=1 Tax=Acrasis kona TaxID=1008807 RepID=A0AAW2Z4L1_9EUKA
MLRYYQRGLYNVNVVNLFNASVKDVTTPGPYNFMIDFHTRREEFEQAREMYNLMLTNKIEPNDETNSLLTTMDVLTRTAPRPVEPKLTKLQEIQSKIEAHNNALTSLISSARYDDAIKLFKDMDLKDGHSYRIITESYARRHMFDLAEDMIKQTIQNEYEISNRTINSMAQEYASAGDVDNAMSIVETAPLIYQVIPSLEVVKRVRSAAYAKERRGEGERFYERMIKNHPIILRTENVNN